MTRRTVVLDPGHGGAAPAGGSSPNNARSNGLLEKDLALDLARRIQRTLNGGARVLLTRDTDANLSLTDRARLARENNADLFVSIHFNGSSDPSVDGSEVWVPRNSSPLTLSFARALLDRLGEVTGSDPRGVRERDLGVLARSRHAPGTVPVLAEVGFLTNPRQARRLQEDSYREELARAFALPIQDHLAARTNGHTPLALGVPPAIAPPAFTLSASVGDGGVNNSTDVEALKRRLVDLGFDWITVNTTMDRETIGVIKLFQSIIAGRNVVSGDGRVDVPGNTYEWLRATNVPRWQLMPAGSAAEGFINVERADPADQHDYGTSWMADFIVAAAAHYRDNYLATHAGAPNMLVNDVSLPRGGDTPEHTGHETGMACDVRLPRNDGSTAGGITWNRAAGSTDLHPRYNQDAARGILVALQAQPLIDRVFFNDPTLIGEGLCARLSGHDNHIHFQIRPPARGPAAGTLEAPIGLTLGAGDGSPFVRMATDDCSARLGELSRNAAQASNPNKVSADRILSETGVRVDANPYFGITRGEIEAVIRAAYEAHQPPEVLLALWAKEGSTRSVTSPRTISQATTEANARTIFRSQVYYEDLGADHFLVTTRPASGGDNVWDPSDPAAPGHERHFAARVQELVRDRLLSEDLTSAVNAELRVTRVAGSFAVEPTTKFYALSLLLVDALFTKFQRNRFSQLSDVSAPLNYMQWNMGTTTFRTFLESADRHRQEPAFVSAGQPITIEQWALHTRPRSNEWRQARINAIKFLHYIESYERIFAPSINLIRPGTDELRDIYSRTAGVGPTAAPVTLNYGVPGGRVSDPFYRSSEERRSLFGRTSFRNRHMGIDVSTPNAGDGGPADPRRGVPVYATVRRTIPLSELNSVRAAVRGSDGNYTDQNGLGISGSGDATLHHAVVRVQPWQPSGDGDYGGVLGLACIYEYTKSDGSSGRFTLYLEFLHLITDTYLPKRSNGAVMSRAEWDATGKGIGFGPRMVNNTTLTAADLTRGTPLLVGYLGATQFPHVHIQCGYASGERNYVRSPRLDPTVPLLNTVTATLGAPETAPAPAITEIEYDVPVGAEYGPRWRSTRPPGLPASARQCSAAGGANAYIDLLAGEHALGNEFVRLMRHLAETESGAIFARPANTFDVRPAADRPSGKSYISAWGCFQFNRNAWRHLPGVPNTAFPWESTASEELDRPIRRYAQVFREVRDAGGATLDCLRGVRLWQRVPGRIYPQYVRRGREAGFATAWSEVPQDHRQVVDRHLREAGLLADSLALGNVSISYDVPLIPQPDKHSCWAGSMAMLVSYYEQASYTPERLANEVGRTLRTSYNWDMLEAVKDHFGIRDIPLPSNMSFVPEPREWYEWLRTLGPLWVTTIGAPSHAIIVRGLHGDLTRDGTEVEINDPWNRETRFNNDPIDFHPFNTGKLYRWTFSRLAEEFGNMGLGDMGSWRVLYIGITPRARRGARTQALGVGAGPAPAAEPDPWARAITLFGGIWFDPAAYPNTVDGFQEYLDATGVRHFTAREMTRPNHPDIAAEVGFTHLLPEQAWWPRGAALALMSDQIRALLNEAVRMRNWWRPAAYNSRVGGAAGSDHITAHAVDLDYSSSDSRRRAERWLRDLARREPWLQLSFGFGDRTTHVGIMSPRGAREWHYAGYTQALEAASATPERMIYEEIREHADPANFPVNLPEPGRGIDVHRFPIPAGLKFSRWEVEVIEQTTLAQYRVTAAPARGADGEASISVDWSHPPYGKIRYRLRAYASADGTGPAPRVDYESSGWTDRTRDLIQQGVPLQFTLRGEKARALHEAIQRVRRERSAGEPAESQEAVIIITLIIAAAALLGLFGFYMLMNQAMEKGYDVRDAKYKAGAGAGASRQEHELALNLTRPPLPSLGS